MLRLAMAFLTTIWLGSVAHAQVRGGSARGGMVSAASSGAGTGQPGCPQGANGVVSAASGNMSMFGPGAASMMGMGSGFNPNFATANSTYGGNSAAMMGMGSGYNTAMMGMGSGYNTNIIAAGGMYGGYNATPGANAFMQSGNASGGFNAFGMGSMNNTNGGQPPMSNDNAFAGNPIVSSSAASGTNTTTGATPRVRSASKKSRPVRRGP
jgi:hypothetical protein